MDRRVTSDRLALERMEVENARLKEDLRSARDFLKAIALVYMKDGRDVNMAATIRNFLGDDSPGSQEIAPRSLQVRYLKVAPWEAEKPITYYCYEQSLPRSGAHFRFLKRR